MTEPQGLQIWPDLFIFAGYVYGTVAAFYLVAKAAYVLSGIRIKK
jgi:hypothetical protein